MGSYWYFGGFRKPQNPVGNAMCRLHQSWSKKGISFGKLAAGWCDPTNLIVLQQSLTVFWYVVGWLVGTPHLRVIQDLENIHRKSSWLLITKHSLVKPFHRKKILFGICFRFATIVANKLRWLAAHPISHVNLKGAYPYQCQNDPRKSWPYWGIMKPNIVHKSYRPSFKGCFCGIGGEP